MPFPATSIGNGIIAPFLPPFWLISPVNLVIHVKSTKITMRLPGTSQKPAFRENPITRVIEERRRRKKLLSENSVRNIVRCPSASSTSGDLRSTKERTEK